MSDSFQFVPVPYEQFASLFTLSEAKLQSLGIRRITVAEKPGVPCRASLVDAEIGETALLLPFAHHDAPSPFQASGPIFVRQGAGTAKPAKGEIPVMFHHRQLSLRAYDAEAMMIGAEVVDGSELQASIGRLFLDENVSYLHIHNARPGCFNCRVDRA